MMTDEKDRKRLRKRGEKESRLDLAVRQLERIACAMVRTSASSDREGKRESAREETRVRTRACAVHYARALLAGQRWRTGRSSQKALSPTSSVRMSAVIDYAQRRARCDSLTPFAIPTSRWIRAVFTKTERASLEICFFF